MTLARSIPPCMCGRGEFATVFHYEAPPQGEIHFSFSSGAYERDILRCRVCGHFVSAHQLEMTGMYEGDYVTSTYGGDGLQRAFERLVSLPRERSDNQGRVRRVNEFAAGHFSATNGGIRGRSVLDVGSGLCVFLYGMKAAGWRCTAVDPDERAARHAHDVVGVDAVCGDFMGPVALSRHDLVTFNKVLEHVVNPVAMLERAHDVLEHGGLVYVELPDGEAAAADGPGREEFFVDHHHIFSAASLALLVERAGFSLLALHRFREPSTKYTLAAFLADRATPGDARR